MEMELEKTIAQLTDLWVFGYGSILWNQGFCFADQLVGYVDGYVRRFWQGNTTHRGTPGSPGRVATLIQQPEGRVWGVAYHLQGSNQIKGALEHLGLRECSLGGYVCQTLDFTERTDLSTDAQRKLPVLTFIATPSNALYLGPADLDSLVNHVIACQGNSGTNVEYVIRMAEFIHANIPEDNDEHLFTLEKKIRERLEVIHQTTDNCSYFNVSQMISVLPNSNSVQVTCVKDAEGISISLLKTKMLEQLLMASFVQDGCRKVQESNFEMRQSSLQAENFA